MQRATCHVVAPPVRNGFESRGLRAVGDANPSTDAYRSSTRQPGSLRASVARRASGTGYRSASRLSARHSWPAGLSSVQWYSLTSATTAKQSSARSVQALAMRSESDRVAFLELIGVAPLRRAAAVAEKSRHQCLRLRNRRAFCAAVAPQRLLRPPSCFIAFPCRPLSWPGAFSHLLDLCWRRRCCGSVQDVGDDWLCSGWCLRGGRRCCRRGGVVGVVR